MKVLRWGVCALAALLMAAGSSFAADSEIDAMKAAMDNMKQEMDAMRATMSAEREAMRESAGGAPEALRTKGGNATVRIGGAVVVRYYANFSSNNIDNSTNGVNNVSAAGPNRGGEYATKIGWTMDTAKIDFDVQINEDLSAYIDIRPDKFDKAYFQWNNIGGTGLGGQIGYIGIPGGMYSASWSPQNTVLINNPFTKTLMGDVPNAAGVSPEDDISRMGVKLYYTFDDQVKITGTIYNPDGGDADLSAMEGGSAVSTNGNVRNYGVNHTLMVEYSPAFMEGLHFSFTYTGQVDAAQRANFDDTIYYTATAERGTGYVPQFNLGVAYVGDKYSVWVSGDYTYAPGFWSNSGAFALDMGANYNVTERFSVAVGGDYAFANSGNTAFKEGIVGYVPGVGTGTGSDNAHVTAYAARVRLGAKYTLCNGVWVRAEYGHTWYGSNIAHRSDVKGADSFVFETGVSF